MNNITYRYAKETDQSNINDLFIEMIQTVIDRMPEEDSLIYVPLLKGYEEGYLDAFFIDENKRILVADFNNNVVGYLSLCMYKESDYLYLDDFCVTKEHQGDGIGSKLIDMAIEYAKEYGINNIRAHVEKFNSQSIEFYSKRGFEVVEDDNNRLLINKKVGMKYDRVR